MRFAYQGFTHHGDIRYFHFRGTDDAADAHIFCLAVRCVLFTENQVPLQAGPQFCLELLHTAVAANPGDLSRFRRYCVVSKDFRPLLLERARLAAIKISKNTAHRSYRKPSHGSQLILQKSPEDLSSAPIRVGSVSRTSAKT